MFSRTLSQHVLQGKSENVTKDHIVNPQNSKQYAISLKHLLDEPIQ